ncbi:MAG: HindIII family type II restriction endonuclease [Alphaproteobacteria bacterium]|nr:HindIII family type II restriction endonuclease [Alphaproteobacteria bacterium]
MIFSTLKKQIKEKAANCDFNTASKELQSYIFSLDTENFIPLITQIGSIPEDIPHDSTEEKLYTKVSDIILAKCFFELNFKSVVLHERANSADVLVESKYHNYSLVADAKAFRLSRTAKNQKDFKVESMVHWRGDNEYSVLCCPYFQYPQTSSQIYGSALNGNVLLFSWEYFNILLTNNIRETETNNLENLWKQSKQISTVTSVCNRNKCFLNTQNNALMNILNISKDDFDNYFFKFKKDIIKRGNDEISYWENVINDINSYSRKQAIDELISALKLKQKINSINKYIKCLEDI